MQRVANCVLMDNNQILLLKKPRRGWYAIPGGKMESGETIKESVVREYKEETGLELKNPALFGAFTFNISNGKRIVQEWMMFTFICTTFQGQMTSYCSEGELEWVPVERVKHLPMAEGDQKIFEHITASTPMLYGSFKYTEELELLDMRLDPSIPQKGEIRDDTK